MEQQSYSRLGRRWRAKRGFRLSSGRFFAPLLRVRLCTLLSLFSRCRQVVKRGFRRGGSRWSSIRSGSRRGLVPPEGRHGGGGGQSTEFKVGSGYRSNSFYAEAIADCLEFIKRSSMAAVEEVSSS